MKPLHVQQINKQIAFLWDIGCLEDWYTGAYLADYGLPNYKPP
jgi:hypothetical protein